MTLISIEKTLSNENLHSLIAYNFGRIEDLSLFFRHEKNSDIELDRAKNEYGEYHFFGILRNSEDFEKRTNNVQEEYEKNGNSIIKKFIDYENKFGCFAWRKV